MPRVAITKTMPSESSATGAPRLKTSMRLPNSRPSCSRRSKNCGDTTRSIARMARRARICASPRRGRRSGISHLRRRDRAVVGGNRRQDRRHADGAVLERADMGAIAQHDDAIRIGDDLVELGGDDEQRKTAIAEFANETDDFRMRADVDAPGRFVGLRMWGRGREPPGEEGLLRFAPGKLPSRGFRIGGSIVEKLVKGP